MYKQKVYRKPPPPSEQTLSKGFVEPMISTHRCCAERRLLSTWVHEARKRGVRNHAVVAWVRRKVGPHISVWRHRHDGSLACATPCVMCSRELARFDLRVNCSQGGDAWFSGRLGEDGAPESRPTMGQIRTMFRPQRDNQEQRRRTTTRVTPQPPRPDWM